MRGIRTKKDPGYNSDLWWLLLLEAVEMYDGLLFRSVPVGILLNRCIAVTECQDVSESSQRKRPETDASWSREHIRHRRGDWRRRLGDSFFFDIAKALVTTTFRVMTWRILTSDWLPLTSIQPNDGLITVLKSNWAEWWSSHGRSEVNSSPVEIES